MTSIPADVGAPAKPLCAAAALLAIIAVVQMLSSIGEPITLLRESLDGSVRPPQYLFAAFDFAGLLYRFCLLAGAAVLAELLDRIRWALTPEAGRLRRPYLASWLLARARGLGVANIRNVDP